MRSYLLAICAIVLIGAQSCIKKDKLPEQFTKIAVFSTIPDSTINIRIDDAETGKFLLYNATTNYMNIPMGFKAIQVYTPNNVFSSRLTYTASLENPSTWFVYKTASNALGLTRYIDTLNSIPTKRDSGGVRIFNAYRNFFAVDLDTNGVQPTSQTNIVNRPVFESGAATATASSRFTPLKSGTYSFTFRRNGVAAPAGNVISFSRNIERGKYYTFVLSGDAVTGAANRPPVVTVIQHN